VSPAVPALQRKVALREGGKVKETRFRCWVVYAGVEMEG